MESTYRTDWEHRWLRRLDIAANRLRSEGAMDEQEEVLHFRRAEDWRDLIEQMGARVVDVSESGLGPFRTTLFVVNVEI